MRPPYIGSCMKPQGASYTDTCTHMDILVFFPTDMGVFMKPYRGALQSTQYGGPHKAHSSFDV